MTQVILFYHPNCNACSELFKILDDKKITQYVNMFEEEVEGIDIQKVPTILNNDEILVGKQCFNFFQKTKEPECLSINKSQCDYSPIVDDNNTNSIVGIYSALGDESGCDNVVHTDIPDNITPQNINDLIKQREEELKR
jgi:hypothetical protein